MSHKTNCYFVSCVHTWLYTEKTDVFDSHNLRLYKAAGDWNLWVIIPVGSHYLFFYEARTFSFSFMSYGDFTAFYEVKNSPTVVRLFCLGKYIGHA